MKRAAVISGAILEPIEFSRADIAGRSLLKMAAGHEKSVQLLASQEWGAAVVRPNRELFLARLPRQARRESSALLGPGPQRVYDQAQSQVRPESPGRAPAGQPRSNA